MTLCDAHKKYKFDINTIPKDYHYLLPTELELLIAELSTVLETIKIPDDFKCGITRTIMSDPVTTQYGQLYDKQFIKKWLKTSKTDPLTNLKLSSVELYPDLRTKRDIMNFLKELEKSQ